MVKKKKKVPSPKGRNKVSAFILPSSICHCSGSRCPSKCNNARKNSKRQIGKKDKRISINPMKCTPKSY
jgi:hypothetical protein